MMKNEDKLALIHKRAHQLRHRRDGTRLLLHGGVCTVLTAVLVFLIGGTSETADTDTLFTGASLLDANVGGYVLTAVAAFMSGTALTALLIKHNKKSKEKNEKKEK